MNTDEFATGSAASETPTQEISTLSAQAPTQVWEVPPGPPFDYQGLPAAINLAVTHLFKSKLKRPRGWDRLRLFRWAEHNVQCHAFVRLARGKEAESLAVAVDRAMRHLSQHLATLVAKEEPTSLKGTPSPA